MNTIISFVIASLAVTASPVAACPIAHLLLALVARHKGDLIAQYIQHSIESLDSHSPTAVLEQRHDLTRHTGLRSDLYLGQPCKLTRCSQAASNPMGFPHPYKGRLR